MVARILFFIYLALSVLALGQRYGFIPLDYFYLSIFCGLPEEICYFTNPIHQRMIDFLRFFGDWAFVPVIACFVLSVLMAFSVRIASTTITKPDKESANNKNRAKDSNKTARDNGIGKINTTNTTNTPQNIMLNSNFQSKDPNAPKPRNIPNNRALNNKNAPRQRVVTRKV